MISIVICSAKEDNIALVSNIKETIGIEHEVIVVHNPKAEYTIAEAYNQGINRANFEYICFIHDDVRILSNNWGPQIMADWVKTENAGLIGVIGTQYKSVFPTPWTCPDIKLNKGRLNQSLKYSQGKDFLLSYSEDPEPVEVVMVDGVFLFTSKNLLNDIGPFDENLKGFHCYDVDLALKIISKGRKVLVSHNVLLEHYSEGKLNNDWFVNQLYVINKWKSILPVSVSESKVLNLELEAKCLKRSIYAFKNNKMNFQTRISYVLFYCFSNPLPTIQYLKVIYKNLNYVFLR